MTHSISTILSFLTLFFSQTSYSQGRVDTDPILYKIQRTTSKIDNDIIYENSIKTDTIYLAAGIELHFYKADSLRKVLKLIKTQDGTQLTSLYFDYGKTIFISTHTNNFKLTTESKKFSKALSSFESKLDTINNTKPDYIEKERASYYFYKDNVRFVAVVIFSDNGLVKKVTQDEAIDIKQGMKLFNNGKTYKLVDN